MKKKKALQAEIHKAIGAEPDEVETIEIRMVWKPSKTKDKTKQD